MTYSSELAQFEPDTELFSYDNSNGTAESLRLNALSLNALSNELFSMQKADNLTDEQKQSILSASALIAGLEEKLEEQLETTIN